MPRRRDDVCEYVYAFRAEGLRVDSTIHSSTGTIQIIRPLGIGSIHFAMTDLLVKA